MATKKKKKQAHFSCLPFFFLEFPSFVASDARAMLSATRPSARNSCFTPQSRRGRGQLLVAAQAARPQRRRRAQQQQLQQRRVAGVGIEAMFAAPQSKRREEPPRCPERPAFHLAPPNGGWVNDPNAPIVDKDGRVHVVSGKRGVCFSIDDAAGHREQKKKLPRVDERRPWCERRRRTFSLPSSLPLSSLFSRILSPAEAGARRANFVLVALFREERAGAGEREGFSGAFFSFHLGGGERGRERARATDERRRTRPDVQRTRGAKRMRSSPFVSSPSRPRHRRAGAGDTSSRLLPLQMDEETTEWGREGAGVFPLDFFFALQQATWLRSKARQRRTNDKGRNFSVTFLPLSPLSPQFSSRSLRSPSSQQLQRHDLDSPAESERELKSRQGREGRV